MCVIIYLPKNTKISKDELRDAFDYNDDGAGIAWIKDGEVFYSKGYDRFNDFYYANLDIINDLNLERVIHFRITSKGKTSSAQCHPFLLSDKKDDMELLDYGGTTPVLFMNGTIFNQKLISGLNDTASYIIEDLYGSSIDFSNSQDLKMIDKVTGAKWAIVETTGVTLIGDFEEDSGVYYSNLYHRWYETYWSNIANSTSDTKSEYDYFDYFGFDDLYDKYDDDKAGWENEDWYAEWLEREYGQDVLDVYEDCLWYDRLTPNESLNVALNYVLDKEEESKRNSNDYIISNDDIFYKHYDVDELLDDNTSLAALFENEAAAESDESDYDDIAYATSGLEALFPPKDKKEDVDVCDESLTKDYLNNVNAPIDTLVDNFSDLVTQIRDYLT